MSAQVEECKDSGTRAEWLTREELATELKVALRTVDGWKKRGVIPCIVIGRVVRFNRAAVSEALARFEKKAIGQ